MLLDQQPAQQNGQQARQIDQPFAADDAANSLRQPRRIGRLSPALQQRLAQHKSDDARDHSDRRRAKAPMPAPALSQIAADYRPDRGADIDAHVENRIGRVAPHIVTRVELPHHCRHAGLEKSGADDDRRKAQPEEAKPHAVRRPVRLHAKDDVPGRDDDATEQHRLALPKITVGQIAAHQGRNVD